MTISDEERAAFDLEQIRAMGDLNCSHDQAWLDAWLAHERRATVERIRRNLLLSEGAPIPEEYAIRVLDEEAARG